MKNMLYKERLKEIQDDMLPFGFTTEENNNANKYTKDNDGNIWFETEWKGSTNF